MTFKCFSSEPFSTFSFQLFFRLVELGHQVFHLIFKMPKVGHFCTAVGLTPDLLKSNGPFPDIRSEQITNGLVIELVRFAKIAKLPSQHVCTWIDSFGLPQTTPQILDSLASKRDQFRRSKQNQNFTILENRQFHPEDWLPLQDRGNENIPPTQEPAAAATTPRELQLKNNFLAYEISQKEMHMKCLRDKIEEEKEALQAVKKKKGSSSVRNTNKRLKRQQQKTKIVQDLQHQLTLLSEKNSELLQKNEVLKKEEIQLQKHNWKLCDSERKFQ